MRASEILGALDAELTPAPWYAQKNTPIVFPEIRVEDIVKAALLRNALPLIADVVETAEMLGEDMWTVRDGDGPEYISSEGLKFLRRMLQKQGAALTALQEHLERSR